MLNPAKPGREAVLDLSPSEFRAIGHELVDTLAAFLEEMPNGKVTQGLTPSQIREGIDSERSLPAEGSEAANVVRNASRLLTTQSLFNGHPRFLGYITSSPAPIGAFADLIASVVNPNCGAFTLSPVATEVELQSIRWIAELIGYHRNCGGLLVSGGNMANIVGIWTARKAMADWDIRNKGLTAKGLNYVIYATPQVHTWLYKTADLLGLGVEAIRWIPADAGQKMDVTALERQIEKDKGEGLLPLAVVGTAGSVGFGVIDPLDQIAEVCKRHKVWFHVDGAYGGLAAALPELHDAFRGLSEADSIAVDPHKWLYCPLEAGCILVKDQSLLLDAFCFHPEYYQFDKMGQEALTNFYEFGPQNSRGFRALKVWLILQQAGRSGIEQMIRDDIRLSRHLNSELSLYQDLEAFTDQLSICTFRYVPSDLSENDLREEYLNRLNAEIINRLQQEGVLFISNAVHEGKYLLRSCIVNFRTSTRDIQVIPEIVSRCGELVDRQLRNEFFYGSILQNEIQGSGN